MTETYSAQIIPFPVRARTARSPLHATTANAIDRRDSALEKWNIAMADLASVMRDLSILTGDTPRPA